MRFISALLACFVLIQAAAAPGQTAQSQPAGKPSLAVIDFAEIGQTGIADAGKTVAEQLLSKFSPDRYQLVNRSQLASLLKEIHLTMDAAQDDPQKACGKLKGVQVLVTGRVARHLGNITITARIVDAASGDVLQSSHVSTEDASGVPKALDELARILAMSGREKKEYPGRSLAASQPAPALQPEVVSPALASPTAGKELTLDLGNRVSMKLALIPAGKFMMGSLASEKNRGVDEGPRHEVTLRKPFYMGVYAVTQEQYLQIMGRNPSKFTGAQNPVDTVSWNEAVEFCKKASLKTGKTMRLPTEAEWEYACRAGGSARFYFGEDDSKLGDYAWYKNNSNFTTHPVGQKKPNNWGLYDLTGNVFQWCSDWYGGLYYSATSNNVDPQGSASGAYRVLRGGGWNNDAGSCRSAYRDWSAPGAFISSIGFRVVVETTGTFATPSVAAATPSLSAQPSQPQSGKDLTLDLGRNISLKLALIPAGKFLMGSPEGEKTRRPDEGPCHEVTISKPFYMGVYTVTQEQYELLMGKNPSNFTGPGNPVENVSWANAVEFCKKLSEKSGKKVRLPTEAEWEYACRAGSVSRFGFGDDEKNLGDYAWYAKNSNNTTHSVGQKKSNAWGLYDMHGNVWQWCSDWYQTYGSSKETDPQGPMSGTERVLRGCGWFFESDTCRSASRLSRSPDFQRNSVGFRVVVEK